MSKEHSSNTTSNTDIQVILAVHRGAPDLITQTYKSIIVINSADGECPAFFNKVIKTHNMPNTIYGFLSEHDYLHAEDSIEIVVNAFRSNKFIGAMYTDSVLMAHTNIPQIVPTFEAGITNHLPINTPLFVTTNLLLPWDTDVKNTYFFDMFKKLSQRTLLGHIPEPIIAMKSHQLNSEEFNYG